MIPEGKHAIGLTGGTTAAGVLRALAHRDDLTIITNSLSIGMEAAEQGQAACGRPYVTTRRAVQVPVPP